MKAKWIVWVAAWAFVFVTAYGGWYFAGALEMGAADGPGAAPAWLHVVRATVVAMLLPLAWLALRIEPAIGYANLEAALLFGAIVAVNSAVLVATACGIAARARRWLRRDSAST